MLLVVVFFVAFASVTLLLWRSLPAPQSVAVGDSGSLTAGLVQYRFPPRSLDDAKTLGLQLGQYVETNGGQVTLVYMVTYIFLQTFAIPGSIFLSILSGALFPAPRALFLVCTCAAIGASLANRLSAFLGRGLVEKYMAERCVALCLDPNVACDARLPISRVIMLPERNRW